MRTNVASLFVNRKSKIVNLPLIFLIGALLLYAIYFSYLTLTRYYAFEARALDLSNFDQAIWNTAQGRWFHLTNQEEIVNRLSLHVEPILIPISWLYWIYPGPPILLIFQSIVVALGTIPLFAVGHLMLHNDWLALLFAFAFLLNPSIQSANWLEFHAVTLAPTFLLAAFYFLVARRTGWFTIFALLAASCKEEMALLVFMLGFYAFVFLKRRQLGLLTMIFSLTWALVAVLGIQNLFANGNIHWGRYGYLGETPAQMVLTLFTQPDVVMNQLRTADALGYVTQLLFPLGFLALFAPEVSLLALPSFAINLLADFPPMHQVDTLIYAAPIVPFVLIASAIGTRRLLSMLDLLARKSNGSVDHPYQAVNIHIALKDHSTTGYPILVPALLILVCTTLNSIWYGYVPWGVNYLPLEITTHHHNAARVIEQIPPEAKVSAQDRLNPHVSGRETVYLFPRLEDADTVFINVTGSAWPQHPNDLRQMVDGLMEQGFGVAVADDGYLLLSQSATETVLPDTFYTPWHLANYRPSRPMSVEFGDLLRLIDVQVKLDRYGELVTRFYWQIVGPIPHTIHFYVAYLDREGNELYSTRFYPPVATLWYPTHLWSNDLKSSQMQTSNLHIEGSDIDGNPQDTIVVQTLPWTLQERHFTLVLGLYVAEEFTDNKGGNAALTHVASWKNSPRLSVTSVEPPLSILEGGTLVRLGGYERQDKNSRWLFRFDWPEWQQIKVGQTKPETQKEAYFGDQIELLGVTVDDLERQSDQQLSFSLYWQAQQPLTIDYQSFVHLLDAAGNTVAQLDWSPHDSLGPLPTTLWQTDVPVIDTQSLPIPQELKRGEYRLITGLYHWQNGVRLPVTGRDALLGDVVEVAKIDIENGRNGE